MNIENIKKSFIPKKRKFVIISATIICILLVALCFVLTVFNNSDGKAPVAELEGVYSISVGGIGGSSYTFRSDGSGVRSYFAEDVENTEEFSYSIVGKTITFNWKDSGKTDSHSFETGKMGGTDVVFINEVTYYKQ